jgi:hypothetical protein
VQAVDPLKLIASIILTRVLERVSGYGSYVGIVYRFLFGVCQSLQGEDKLAACSAPRIIISGGLPSPLLRGDCPILDDFEVRSPWIFRAVSY